MKLEGPVRVDPDHPRYGGKRPWQYEWLSAALRRNRPDFDGGWPWWLACKEPDLEACRASKQPGGSEQALIELELPEDRCARFPLWMWETIHLGRYLALSRDELEEWYRELDPALSTREQTWPLPEPWKARVELSWERLLEGGVPCSCWYRDEPPEVQARMADATDERVGLTQELRSGDVVEVTPFTAAES